MPKITVILHVEDVQDAVDFYTGVMEFEINFVARDETGEAFHSEVVFDGAPLMISHLRHRPEEEQKKPHGAGVIIQLDLDSEIDAYYDRIVARGGMIVDPLADRYWGQRSFLIEDPNGYTLSIAMDLPGAN